MEENPCEAVLVNVTGSLRWLTWLWNMVLKDDYGVYG